MAFIILRENYRRFSEDPNMMARMCRRRRCFRPAIDPRDASARRNQPACALLIAGSVFSAGARARSRTTLGLLSRQARSLSDHALRSAPLCRSRCARLAAGCASVRTLCRSTLGYRARYAFHITVSKCQAARRRFTSRAPPP